jgi:SAM-dependent methyltransferase
MARPGHPIHRVLVEALNLHSGHTLLDLGCGIGRTLRCAVDHVAGVSVIGIDSNQVALDYAITLLSDVNAQLQCGDLSKPIQIEGGTIDRIVCHNVLECLEAPDALLAEASRLLAPEGRAVWSHIDCGGIVINSSNEELNRNIVAAYANHLQGWMDHVDGQMGRKLPGLIRQSGLQLDKVAVHTTYSVELAGDALAKIDEMTAALSDASSGVSAADLATWRADVEKQHLDGTFFFMEPTVVVTARAGRTSS